MTIAANRVATLVRIHRHLHTVDKLESVEFKQYLEKLCRDLSYMASGEGAAMSGNVMGPWLVTADEIPDPYNLQMIVRVNGEEWGRGNSGTMHHKFEDMIAHASRDETLQPGEFLGSGTVGNGCGLEHDRWIKPNDVIELEIAGLGTLRNRVVGQ